MTNTPASRGLLAPSVRALWERSILSPVALLLLGCYDLWIGVTFLVSDRRRFLSPTYSVLTDVGGPAAAGAAFTIIGVGLLASPAVGRRTVASMYAAGALVQGLVTVGFLLPVITEPPPPADPNYPMASLLGYPTFGVLALIHFVNAVLHARDRATSQGLSATAAAPTPISYPNEEDAEGDQ